MDREPRRRAYVRTLEEMLIFLGPFGCTLYWTNQDFNKADWDLRWDWPSWKRKIITFDAVRFDSNDFWTNNATHAASGLIYYWIPRSNGLSIAASFGVAFLGSAAWEYLVEFKENPSLNDMIYTPLVGLPIGESIFQLGELFDRGSNGLGIRVLAEILGAPRKLHDRLDGAGSRRAKAFDALGLPADVYHRFTLSAGLADTWTTTEAPPQSRFDVGFESEVVDLPHYGKVGHAGGFVTDRGFTRLAIEASIGERRVERLSLDARATLFGWYHQEIDRDAAGDLRGSSFFLGAATSLDYVQRWIGSIQDRMTVVRGIGLASDTNLHAGGLSVHASADASFDFAMVTPLSAQDWLATEHRYTKSIVSDSGYYYAIGFSIDPKITLRYSRFDVGFAGRFDTFSSIDGRDRLQDRIQVDAHLTDRRIEWKGFAGVTAIEGWRFQASFTQRYRESHVAGFSASNLERSAVVATTVSF